MYKNIRTVITIVGVLEAVAGGAGIAAQKMAPADAAARLTGTWTLNRELTPGFKAPGGRPGGPGRGGASARLSAGASTGLSAGSALFSVAAPAFAPQRGGGGGAASSPSDLSPAELAAQAAMRQLQQLADEITINATAEKVTFIDTRGERTYTLDGKNAKITVAGSDVSTKSRWDKSALRQEFSTASAKLTQTWDIDNDGRLVLTAKLESLRLMTPEQKAVFDKKGGH